MLRFQITSSIIFCIILLLMTQFSYSNDSDCLTLLGEPCSSHDAPLNSLRRAALFSNYGLAPGNGERYFLSFVQVLKSLSYDIDIILFEDNECFMSACVEETLKALRLKNTIYDDFTVRLIPETSLMFAEYDEYDIFVSMGISKFPRTPAVKAIGKYYNIYICQFPFDWKRGMKDMDLILDVWASYDTILVNSRYSFDWYLKAVVPWIHRGINRNIYIPNLNLLHPPVDPFPSNHSTQGQAHKREREISKLPDRSKLTNIVYLGPFSLDPNKMDTGLKFFKQLTSRSTAPLRLHYIGRVEPMSNSDLFLTSLQANATLLGLDVSYDLDASPEAIGDTLSSSLIAWHIVALDMLGPNRTTDPGGDSFASNLVETMFAGCIPVATNIAGTTDIVHPPHNGLLVNSEEDIVKHTLELLSLPDSDIQKMRKSAIRTAASFSSESFNKNLKDLLSKGVRAGIVRDIVRRRIPDMWSLPLQIRAIPMKYHAVLIVPALHSTLEACVRNVMSYLGNKWSLQVLHLKSNEAYVRQVLSGVPNVAFQLLKAPMHRPADYNRLLKSPQFWSQFDAGDKIVLFNLDTVLLRSGIEAFLDFDFVAAPMPLKLISAGPGSTVGGVEGVKPGAGGMHGRRLAAAAAGGGKMHGAHGNHAPHSTHYTHNMHRLTRSGVGFGGFSVRSATAMLQIATDYGAQSDDTEPESVFFARVAAQLGFKVADRRQSFEFAWELDCPDLRQENSTLPLALQAAWNHMNLSIINALVDKNMINSPLSLRSLPSSSLLADPRYAPVFNPSQTDKKKQAAGAAKKRFKKTSSRSPAHLKNSTTDYPAAWALLRSPGGLLDEKAGLTALDELGLLEPSDLALCDAAAMQAILDLVKPELRVRVASLVSK